MEIVLDRHIERQSDLRGGVPRIKGTRISVDDIVLMYTRMGQSLEEIAAQYDLPLAAVYAAMAYYHDHREDVEAKIAADEAFVEDQQRDTPYRLQQRLKELRGG